MKTTTKFSLKGLALSGEWDAANQMVFISELGGELGVVGNLMGMAVNVRGVVDVAMDNYVQVKITSIGQLPGFLIPGILFLVKASQPKLAKAVSLKGDHLFFDPNQLVPQSSGVRVLVQPTSFTISDEAVSSLRERILSWTEKNAGAIAKETVDLILTLPDLIGLFIRLAKDPRLAGALKLKIALCIAYVVSPLDLIPEVVAGPLGFADDAVAMGLLLANLTAEIAPEIIRENWSGRPDVLELILQGQALMGLAGKLPDSVLEKLASLFGSVKSEAAATS